MGAAGSTRRETRFWDRIAERYARRPVADEAAYQRKLAVTRERLRPDMELLEVGCGTGSTAIAHAPYVKHVHATDISSRMIEIARRKAADASVANVTFEQTAVEDLGGSGRRFDAVLALSLLHLLEDKESVLASLRDLLVPDGLLVTSTACLGDTMKWFELVGPVGRFLGLIPRVEVFTVKELETSIVAAGFRIEHQWQPARGKAVFIVARKAG